MTLDDTIARYRERASAWHREVGTEESRTVRDGDRHAQAARHCRRERDDWHALGDLLYAIAYPDTLLGEKHLTAAAERLARRLDPEWEASHAE